MEYSTMQINIRGGDNLGPIPPRIRDALIKALYEADEFPYANNSYPPTGGVPEFKRTVAEYYHKRWNVKYDPGQILPTVGAGPSYLMIIDALLKPGDEVILTDPSFSAYYSRMPERGLKVLPLPLKKQQWHFDPEDLRKLVTRKTRMILLCTPNNPSGTVYTREEMAAIEDVAEENDLYVLPDEIYQEIVFDGKSAILPEQFKGLKERTIVCNSISKITHGTGWRLGFIIAPEELYSKVLSRYLYLGNPRPPTFIQVAGVAVYKEPWDYMEEIRKEYEVRRNFFVQRINEIEGLSVHKFEGAFYAFIDIRPLGIKTAEFVAELGKNEKLLIQDGEIHGVELSKGHLRAALTLPVPGLEEACNRLERFVKSLKK